MLITLVPLVIVVAFNQVVMMRLDEEVGAVYPPPPKPSRRPAPSDEQNQVSYQP
ncbi:MAG: hypothetical protein KGY81_09555 [Phycisphaerae bacterium]|nr:hypothetical protein [Phycisphaerae bacterium]